MVSQFYVTEAENEYVIRANSAIMKCKIPSFVSEFVQVDQWVADDGTVYMHGEEYGMTPIDADVVCVVVRATASPFSYFPIIFISHPQTSSRTFFSFVPRQPGNCRLQFTARDKFQLLLSDLLYSQVQSCTIVLGSVFKLRDKYLKDGYEDDNNSNCEKHDDSAEF